MSVTGRSARRLLGEFFLIVAGVLVALAVESWRQEQADLRLVDSYLVSLETEMVQDTFISRVYTDVSEHRSAGLRQLLASLDGEVSLSPREELLALHWAYNDESPPYVSAVLDELLVTGNARLLESDVLAALQQVSQRFEIGGAVIAGLNFPLEGGAPGVVPGHMRRALRESIRSDGRWVFTDSLLAWAADSLLAGARTAEIASLRSWSSSPIVRALLEEQYYASEAYSEELAQDQLALLHALGLLQR